MQSWPIARCWWPPVSTRRGWAPAALCRRCFVTWPPVGDGGWFVPYYVDYGVGAPSNNSWQAYAGVGKATRGGAFLLLFRDLNYDFAPGAALVQKLRLGGPLLGYTFKL